MAKGIHDSGKYRDPTEHEVAEIIRLRWLMQKAERNDDAEAKARAAAAMKRLLATMEIKE